MADTPGAVLFACNYNAVRSPMAEGLMKSLYGHSIFIDSAGVRPIEEANPFMIEVMAEIGIDMSGHQPKTFGDIEDSAESFDLVITMSPEAQHRAVELTRYAALDVEYWMTFDPVAVEGNRDMILDAFRGVRDHIRTRIAERFPSTSLSAI